MLSFDSVRYVTRSEVREQKVPRKLCDELSLLGELSFFPFSSPRSCYWACTVYKRLHGFCVLTTCLSVRVELFNVPAALPVRLRLDHYRFIVMNVSFFAALVNCLAISLLFTLSPSLRNVNLCHSQNACQTEWFLLNHTWRAPCIDGGLVTTLVTRKKAEDSISPLFCGRTILTLWASYPHATQDGDLVSPPTPFIRPQIFPCFRSSVLPFCY